MCGLLSLVNMTRGKIILCSFSFSDLFWRSSRSLNIMLSLNQLFPSFCFSWVLIFRFVSMSSARIKILLTIYHKSTISLPLTPKWRKKSSKKSVREKEEKVWSISAKSHVGKGCKWCKEQLKRSRREQLGNKSRKAAGAKLAVGSPDGRKGKWEQKWEQGVCVWSSSRAWGACSEELKDRKEASEGK